MNQTSSNVPLRQPPVGIARDFVNRIESKPCVLSGEDVLAASAAAVAADERAERIVIGY